MAKRKRKKKDVLETPECEELSHGEDKFVPDKKVEEKPKKERPKRVRPKRNPMPLAGKPVSFKAWFTNAIHKERRLRPQHYSALFIYMVGLGYGSEEVPAKYNKGLESYFGK